MQVDFPGIERMLRLIGAERLADYFNLWVSMVTGLIVRAKIPELWNTDKSVVRMPTGDFLRVCEYLRIKCPLEVVHTCEAFDAYHLRTLIHDNDLEALDDIEPPEAALIVDILNTQVELLTFDRFYNLNGGLEETAWRWIKQAPKFRRIKRSGK